jgi:hypothetical protein
MLALVAIPPRINAWPVVFAAELVTVTEQVTAQVMALVVRIGISNAVSSALPPGGRGLRSQRSGAEGHLRVEVDAAEVSQDVPHDVGGAPTLP